MTDPNDIKAEIIREEKKLSELKVEIEQCSARLSKLQKELGHLTNTDNSPPSIITTMSNPEKVSLFRSLFRGREDVFPRRWENLKTDKSGYSPLCLNEWQTGLCEKKNRAFGDRKPTCADCPNKSYQPVTDEEIAKHLRGTHVMGVYPMLLDETCWFLAADFDEKSWQDDVLSFVETCKIFNLPVSVERSRSGNGAHAWFFFSSPVQASVARKMGCFLITETMARRHQLSMESYDRLFPNQDTMPKGGFGNLIALPLQRQAREQGNSVFVDQHLNSYQDQWDYLANIKKIDPCVVQSIASEAIRKGQVIGVQMSETDDDAHTPWDRPPSRRHKPIQITEPLPAKVRAVVSQRLFIEKAGLPSPLINQLKRLAAFQNPEFYKKQGVRLSTALTPRIISCAEELPEYIALPRGCFSAVEEILQGYSITLDSEDKREEGLQLQVKFNGVLTETQKQATASLLAHETGIFVAPPGIGKTVVGTYLVAARARSTLILVHRKPLLDQWVAQLAHFLNINPKEIGQIGAGKNRPNGKLDVAMLQSLVRKDEVDNAVANYGQVIVDECHHIPAVSFERVLSEVKARFVVGLTATPQRKDGHHPILQMQIGPVRFSVDMKRQANKQPFTHLLITRNTRFNPVGLPEKPDIQVLYAKLASDIERNDLIFDDVVKALDDGRSPILLTERRDHLEHFEERLRKFTRHLVVLHGGMSQKMRREALQQLAAIPVSEERLLLATGRYIGEGFDDARLDTLFLAMPVSWRGTLVQYTGRLHRLHPGKTEVRIYDYVDYNVPVLFKMFEKRLRGYRAIGYLRDEDSQQSNSRED